MSETPELLPTELCPYQFDGDCQLEIEEIGPCLCANNGWNTRTPARPDGEAVAWRERLIHTICPHIKRWSDGDGVPETPCQNCPPSVQTSQGEGVQMCRLNAQRAADDILALAPSVEKK